MALRTFVKINGITNLTDARYCSGMYVNLLGFSFENQSDRFISPDTFKEISGWLSGVDFVAEFDSANSESIQNILDQLPEITWIEHKNIDTLLHFKEKGLQPILKLSSLELQEFSQDTLSQLKDSEILIHLANDQNAIEEEENKLLLALSKEIKILLGTGINSSNVERKLDELRLFGIAMTGGDEIKPGLTDFNELADILEILELED